MIRSQAAACLRRTLLKPQQYTRSQRCRMSSATNASFNAQHVPASSASPLATITNELDKISPRFSIPADAIEIIRSPTEFYNALKTRISKAKRRIYLATLYVGKTEHDLIDTLRAALRRNPELQVSFLTDALRGTREAPEPSCASLLASLISEFGPDRVEVRLYHTPNLTGVRKAVIPKRINEGWGLQHMKLYGIDDEIIMSGANLSNDYFTNRQDRYHIFKSRAITDFFYSVHRAVCDLSYRVDPAEPKAGGFNMNWPAQNSGPAPLDRPGEYVESATKSLRRFTQLPTQDIEDETKSDTHVYPLLQLTPLLKPDTSTELPAVTTILRALPLVALRGSKWTFTAGYFNMTPEFRKLLLESEPSSATVVAASPWANGFYGSKGVSGMLPAAYTYLSRKFLDAVTQAGLSSQISVKEWRKGTVNEPDGWTYHAKGIWVTLPGQQDPSVSLIGSSNYTKRSYSLDLEANTLIVTSNPDLQKRLGEEEAWLQDHATTMTRDDYAKTERRVGLHVRIAMAIVTLVGGAL